ncbi:MAG: AbrB/MazE/SpoVT family DNA-binding domain-containing protein [Candidatus Rokubacteria bacterium]|nr:AbrB/MazE/SpoVT family DNA-binding domain-containing protein [Candidatus Rokubacteria bacterium]
MKKLTRTGNSFAVILDKQLLEAAGIDADTSLDVSTDGDVIVISPVRIGRRAAKVRKITADAHRRYGGVFKRLAE